jgi:phosphotriesterase-related protein
MAREQVELFRTEHVDLDRVVIGHIDTQLHLQLARELIEAGVLIGIDTIGKQNWDFFLGPTPSVRPEGKYEKHAFFRSDIGRADLVAALVADGFASRIILSHDLTGAEVWMNPSTLGQWGYSYLDAIFLPMLRERGVTESDIDQMLVRTPARLLGGAE